ncbi:MULTISPECIES: FkbM family methyltransferase [unclassified Caballeronia]|uniref:FkbM family methyltransferase n=1 Tax=unclassified Caballeronia TaxID=2646786 RepID=UPI002028973E|nr:MULTISPECIES: FkbM family methyltransferase [unclassified Caballeronia]
MMHVPYTIAVPTIYGQMLVNRNDLNQTNILLRTGAGFDVAQIEFAKMVCANGGAGGLALDIGANFGTYTLGCAQALAPLGGIVHAFEPQRTIAYMLCGSIALNSIENAIVHVACVGDRDTKIDMPRFDYHQPMNFGSIEFGEIQVEKLHQERCPSSEKVQQVRIDDFDFKNIKFIKIDTEGMEFSVLQGSKNTIVREKPIVVIEYIKSNKAQLADFFEKIGYKIWTWEGDLLCIHHEQLSGIRSRYKIDLPEL